MGKAVSTAVGARLGSSLLELGGNNAIIITPTADLKMVVPGAVFGAVGTAGQRCTTTRRLIIHEEVYDKVKDAIVKAYGQLKIGNPLDQNNHVGPLIDKDAVTAYENALKEVVAEGGKLIVEGGVLTGEGYESGCYVKPAIAEAQNHFKIVQHETFAPVLYLMKYSGSVENAIALQNGVPQGLSSAIMTNNLREAEAFLAATGSARKKRGAAVSRDRMHGKFTCAARRIPSTIRTLCHWLRESNSICKKYERYMASPASRQ
jgi:aldehyde dehydrogenase (NAD+)